MKYTGSVWKFGDDIDTDFIIPARYLTTSDPNILDGHCMEDADPGFISKIKKGDILVTGKNFGCGSSREHAPISIKAAGISCVIAKSFARIFYRNAFNMGLPIFESPVLWDRVSDGDLITVDSDEEWAKKVDNGSETFPLKPIPLFMRELMNAGGLMSFLSRRQPGGMAK
jgi:3-isopropylmalate/(R)-2-methylmalate dehydratase small subunit